MKSRMIQLIRSLEPQTRKEFIREIEDAIRTAQQENELTEAESRYCEAEGINPDDFRNRKHGV